MNEIDPILVDLLPHRPPMLLLNKMVMVSETQAHAKIYITKDSPFCEAAGVPSWIGIEYMGQTAALIAGDQASRLPDNGGLTKLGFLLGTRRYQTCVEWFQKQITLDVYCQQIALVGESLATFDCRIESEAQILSKAKLSVIRKHSDHSL